MKSALAAAFLLAISYTPAQAQTRDDRYFVAWGGMAPDVLKAKRCAPPFGCGQHLGHCLASHYGTGDGYGGRRTASGERMNPGTMTAAHRSLPFGTRLRVTHGDKSVVVRINDRGPFVRGRCIDLSTGAARAIGLPGTGQVRIEAQS